MIVWVGAVLFIEIGETILNTGGCETAGEQGTALFTGTGKTTLEIGGCEMVDEQGMVAATDKAILV